MSWVAAAGYVVATALAAVGVSLRQDPRIAAALGTPRKTSPRPVEELGRRVARWIPYGRIDDRLRGLGRPDWLQRMLGWKLISTATASTFGLLVPLTWPVRALAMLILGLGGWVVPDFLLARRLTARGDALALSVPDLLDLVDVGISAGLTPTRALERAVDEAPETLRPLLTRARRRVGLGDRWTTALAEIGETEEVETLGRAASALERASRLGAPVEPTLRAIARDARAERDLRLEERAGRAPILMLFPLVFCILPAFILSAVVPAALVAIRGIQ